MNVKIVIKTSMPIFSIDSLEGMLDGMELTLGWENCACVPNDEGNDSTDICTMYCTGVYITQPRKKEVYYVTKDNIEFENMSIKALNVIIDKHIIWIKDFYPTNGPIIRAHITEPYPLITKDCIEVKQIIFYEGNVVVHVIDF